MGPTSPSAMRAGLTFGLAFGLAFGLGAGLGAGLLDSGSPGIRLRLSLSGSLPWLGVVFAAGFVVWPVFGLAAGIVVGLVAGLVAGLRPDEAHLTSNSGPRTLLMSDRRAYLVAGLATGLVFGLATWLTFGLVPGLVVGPAFGLAVGLTFGLTKTAWGHFILARAYLAVRHNTPWDLMAFLQDAHERHGVLRQIGAVYQFRHIDLQRHLAQ